MSTDVEKLTDAKAYLDALKAGQISFDDRGLFDEWAGGHELLKDDALDRLVGIPFAVLAVTFRGGFQREIAGVKAQGDYVTAEIILGDERSFVRANVPGDFPYNPLDMFVFNDGSTGIRRQIVAYLVSKGVVELQKGLRPEDIKAAGGLGESDYDIPVGLWHDFRAGDVRFDNDGGTVFQYTFERPLLVRRGLRLSEYVNEKGNGKDMVTTRYFA